jgi:hypothetical protein
MQIALQGIFENGQIKLKALPPQNVKTDVIVVFEAQEMDTEASEPKKGVRLGSLAGMGYSIPDDFNESIF